MIAILVSGTLIIYKDTAVYENERIPSEVSV